MKKDLIILLTLLSLFACKKENEGNLILIEADSQKGFNFPYLLFLPDTISDQTELRLIVEPNNSGFANDDLKEHLEKARRTASKDFYIGNFVARKLHYPLLVPVFPRPETDWKIYTHALDRDAVIQKNNLLERLDLQLIKMIDNARDTLRSMGYMTRDRVLMTGFSASGTFANRFSLIHPNRVFAVAAGGLNGILILPADEINGNKLNYPLGTNDFRELLNESFDSITFKQLPQFLFMGENDDNDAVLYDDGYEPAERETVFRSLGTKMQPDRWNACSDFYRQRKINATIVTYDSIGHEHPLKVKEDIVEFFRTLTSGPGTARYSTEVEERIIRVENSLAGWLKTGENDTWSLDQRMEKYNVNGVSIAVIHDYKIEWARGYGYADVSEKRRVTEKTLFQAASISKSLNSVGVLRLVQDGRLDLDTDINKYLVTWKFPYDGKTGKNYITLRQLLSHTAGMTVHGFPGYEQGSKLPSVTQILDGKAPANTEPVRSYTLPGKEVQYSGGGTTVSQLIVMDVTKKPYADFMQKNVLDPLGMTSSSYLQPPAPEKRPLIATGYKADGSEVKGKFHVYPEQAAAGLVTNPSDLSRYIIETQLAFKGESSKILSAELTRMRVTPVKEDSGLGTFINSRVTGSSKYFNHNGGNEGFSCTSVGSLSEGNGVVVMTNSDNSAIIEEIVNSVATVYKWKDYYLPLKIRTVAVNNELLDKYSGKYDLDGTPGTISKTPGGLVFNAYGADWKLYFTTDSDFHIQEMRGSFRFRTGDDGKVKGIIFRDKLLRKLE